MKPILTLFLATAPLVFFAQKPYFQQEVHYKIVVSLDDQAHTLTGDLALEYLNHSPDALDELWLHCWPNAYSSRRSGFNEQKLRQRDSKFHFAKAEDRGGLSNLDFRVNGRQAEWSFDPENPDIVRLKLPQPLPPGGRLSLTTPFVLDIPASFSRLGHVGQSYQMTQWFPKPAVYDARGWHPMPYLDQGEFYSEFGSFDVSITLPANYVVGATGTLQTPGELAFLQQKAAETLEKARAASQAPAKKGRTEHPFPPSAGETKTLRYTAENVHDFAWFADKRFNVLHDTARLASGRTVDCWAMFSDENFRPWLKGAFYVRRAVEFYSEHVGEYPWPHATAVHSALSAGGGMEYPMITVIGNTSDPRSLDEVITHEVGHNWFYGILASNERDHAWMDEGFNTYYEMRYMKQYYGGGIADDALPKGFYDPKVFGPPLYTAYLLLARNYEDAPPDTRSDRFTGTQYGLQVYMKPALCLAWLEKATGTAAFDAAMKSYFRDWKFRHPYPEDLRASWQAAGLSADWFFEAMTTQKRTDYALKNVEKVAGGYRLTVENKEKLNAPFPVTALRNGQPVGMQWYPAPAKSRETVVFAAEDADGFAIDREFATLDLRGQNNQRGTRIGVRGFAPLEYPRRRVLGVLPWAGWNNYDKTMAGLILYSPPLPRQRLQYYLLPGFGFGSKRFVGLADLRYLTSAGEAIPRLTVGLSAKTFDYDYDWQEEQYTRFYRFVPQVKAELRSQSPAFRHWVQLRALFIGREQDEYDIEGNYTGRGFERSTLYDIRYVASQQSLPHPFVFRAGLEFQRKDSTLTARENRYLRATAEWRQQFYYRRGKKITVRAFAGSFLLNDQRNGALIREALALNPQGFNDYRFDQVFFGRSENDGFFSQQVGQSDGGFKNAFGAPFAGIGNSNSFVAALNLKADLPFRIPLLPIKPYFDLGYYQPAKAFRPEADAFLWSGGLMLEFFGGALEVYFPLVNAEPLRNLYEERGDYSARISWSVRFGRVTPNDIVDLFLP